MAASIFRDEVRDVLFRKARQCTKKNEVVRVSPAGEWDPSRLKKLRSSLHISQAVLADIMGVSKAAVIAWEHGVNIPSGACARLLDILYAYPDILLEAARERTGCTQAQLLLTENQSLFLGAGKRCGYGMIRFLQKPFPLSDVYFRLLL